MGVVDLLFYAPLIVLFVVGLCSSLFWYALLYVVSSFPIILSRKRENLLKHNVRDNIVTGCQRFS